MVEGLDIEGGLDTEGGLTQGRETQTVKKA